MNKKAVTAVGITAVIFIAVFASQKSVIAQTEGGTNPKVACAQDFCLVAWAQAGSLVGKLVDKFGNTKTDLTFAPGINPDAVLLEASPTHILVAYFDPSSGSSDSNGLPIYYLKTTNIWSNSVGQISYINSPVGGFGAKPGITYDPVNNKFFIASGGAGLFIGGDSAQYTGSVLLPGIATGTGDNKVAYNKDLNLFMSVSSGAKVVDGVSQQVAFLGGNNQNGDRYVAIYDIAQSQVYFPYSETGDLLYNPSGSSHLLVYPDQFGYIVLHKFNLDPSLTYKQTTAVTKIWGYTPPYQGFDVPTSVNPTPEDISSSPVSLDQANNRYVLAFSRQGTGYVQLLDSNLNGLGSEISLGSVLSPPVITYNPSSGKHLLAYATAAGIQTKFVDSGGSSAQVLTPRTYTQPEDPLTAQYSVSDQTNNAALSSGSKRLSDISASFTHPTLGQRLKATLTFAQADVDLTTLLIDSTDTATAVNSVGTKGLTNKVIVVPNNNNGGGVRACPYAKTIDKITPNCLGELQFKGPFPEKQGEVEVKLTASPSPGFYEISGLSGSGVGLLEAAATTTATSPTPIPSPSASTSPSQTKKQSDLAVSSTTWSSTAKDVTVKASYTTTQTATSPTPTPSASPSPSPTPGQQISGATCKIKYSDQLIQETPMTFDSASGQYKTTRTFQTIPSGITATVTCSSDQYITQTSTISLSTGQASSPSPTPRPSNTLQGTNSVTLGTPSQGQTIEADVTFACTGQGDIKELSLYTDISGSWKKEETKTITTSPSTQQFKKVRVSEGTYKWNCEGKTSEGLALFGIKNQSFKVGQTTNPQTDCIEQTDCGVWSPATCPQTGTQTRTCSNTDECGYPLSRSCVYTGGGQPRPTDEAGPESRVPTPSQANKGIDILPIILVVVLIIAAIGGVLFFLKKRQGSGEGGLFPSLGGGES